jgi:hypothetical protein
MPVADYVGRPFLSTPKLPAPIEVGTFYNNPQQPVSSAHLGVGQDFFPSADAAGNSAIQQGIASEVAQHIRDPYAKAVAGAVLSYELNDKGATMDTQQVINNIAQQAVISKATHGLNPIAAPFVAKAISQNLKPGNDSSASQQSFEPLGLSFGDSNFSDSAQNVGITTGGFNLGASQPIGDFSQQVDYDENMAAGVYLSPAPREIDTAGMQYMPSRNLNDPEIQRVIINEAVRRIKDPYARSLAAEEISQHLNSSTPSSTDLNVGMTYAGSEQEETTFYQNQGLGENWQPAINNAANNALQQAAVSIAVAGRSPIVRAIAAEKISQHLNSGSGATENYQAFDAGVYTSSSFTNNHLDGVGINNYPHGGLQNSAVGVAFPTSENYPFNEKNK